MKKLVIVLMVKKCFFLFLITSILFQQRASSQALPVAPAANFVMNRAVAGVLTRVAVARGFAANDPRIATTLLGVSSSLTAVNTASTVAGVGLAIAGAPVWITVAGGLGVLAVGAAIVAGTSSMSIANTGTGNKLQILNSPVASPPAYTSASTVPMNFARFVNEGQEIYRDSSCYSSDDCYAFPPLPSQDIPIQWKFTFPGSGTVVIVFWSIESFKAKWTPWGHPPGVPFNGGWQAVTNLSTASWTSGPTWDFSQSGRRLVGSLQLTFQNPPEATPKSPTTVGFDSTTSIILSPNLGPQLYASLDDALANISPAIKSQPLSNATIAQVVDSAWKNAAAQPGYQGLPYSVTQPVTATDVATWQAENPTSMPSLNDLLAPASLPNTSTVPISVTTTTTNPNPNPTTNPTPDPNAIYNVNIVNVPRVDLGPNPNIAAPTLEATPGALEILYPLFTLFPELKNYQAPQHKSECPKPQFDLFGKTITMDSHCTIAEQHRLAIGSIMIVAWMLVSIFILLSA